MDTHIRKLALTPQRRRQFRRRVEVASALLLAVGGLATSWSSFQASRWSSLQAAQYSLATNLRVEASWAHETAAHLYAIDIAIFSSWANAYAADDLRLEKFYRERFRAEFTPAFDAWVASAPMKSPTAASTPFALPLYQLAKEREAGELTRRSDSAVGTAQRAGTRGDSYFRTAVLLASVMFLLGVVQQFHIWRVQILLMTLAVVLLSIGIADIAALPRL